MPDLNDERDVNDLPDLVHDITNRPRDIVAKEPYRGPYDDLKAALESGEIRWPEFTPEGVTEHRETQATFTEPFLKDQGETHE